MQQLQNTFEEHKHVRWIYKLSGKGSDMGLVEAPLDMATLLRKKLFDPMRTAVSCSATLTTDGTFDFLCGGIGLQPEQLGRGCF